MSSIEMKIDQLKNTPSYSTIDLHTREIDLLNLLSILYAAKKKIVVFTLIFVLCALAISFLIPKKWTSQAIVTPPENLHFIELRRIVNNLSVLGVETNIDSDKLYNLFLKKFASQELREMFLAQSSYVRNMISHGNDDKIVDVDKSKLHHAIVNISQNFTSIDNNTAKSGNKLPYSTWTLSFTARDANDAQQVLQSYIEFITTEVNKVVIANIKDAIALKAEYEKNKLTLDRNDLENQHNIKMTRLGYSLQVANAAGLKTPVYSNGEAVKDDPDYSISLGADGLAEKLKIEQSITNVAQLNASLQNREHLLNELQTIQLGSIDFKPYNFQLKPSLPVKKNGPGMGLMILLTTLVGLIGSAASVLIREMMASRMPDHAV